MNQTPRTPMPIKPWYWIVAGAIVLVFAIGYTVDDTFPLAVGIIGSVAGAGLLLYGIIATATQHGAAAGRGDRPGS